MTLPCPIYSCSEISLLFSDLSRTGFLQGIDSHSNHINPCFPNSAFVTLLGPTHYSKVSQDPQTKLVLIHSKFESKYVPFCDLGPVGGGGYGLGVKVGGRREIK